MAKCSNCTNEAFFEYIITASNRVPFCKKHIPGFLKSETYAPRLVKIEKAPVVEAPKPPKKKPVVVEEPPVVEEVVEPVVEEPIVEESTPEVTEAE